MFDCADDILDYHDKHVTLPTAERDEMRARRDSNRDRLRKGLRDAGKPAPLEFRSQGSYAMKTMLQDPAKRYDIDDGVYFAKEDLVGPRGGTMTASDAKWMVRDAIDDGSFATPPEVRTNCVRIYYAKGYHVDLPVYRRVTTTDIFGNQTYHYELASTDWVRSDARDVTAWFDRENAAQSPDTDNGRQLRRITRLIKKFARSREGWLGRILSGFGITALVVERYCPNAAREDQALYDTMRAIRDRLAWNLVVKHPVTPGATITSGTDDAKARYLRDRLTEALDTLEPLFAPDCIRKKARSCWDKVFNTDFFSSLEPSAQSAAMTSAPAGILAPGISRPAVVRKEGGGTYG